VLTTLEPGGDPDQDLNRSVDRVVVAVLVVDAVLLALLELCFVQLSIGAVPVPVSALVALLTTPWLVLRAGEFARGHLGSAAPLIGWIATVCLLGFTGPGGDVVITDSWPSLVFILCGMVPAAFVLGRVLRTKPRAR
jgi:hypothetical protein